MHACEGVSHGEKLAAGEKRLVSDRCLLCVNPVGYGNGRPQGLLQKSGCDGRTLRLIVLTFDAMSKHATLLQFRPEKIPCTVVVYADRTCTARATPQALWDLSYKMRVVRVGVGCSKQSLG